MVYLFKLSQPNITQAETQVAIEEDEIDTYLDKQSGLIKRERDEML
jgi:hypothetical protein